MLSHSNQKHNPASPLKFLFLLAILNIAFQLISDVTAGKIMLLFGAGVSVTVLYFPFTYIISDVLTEVYGYARARKVLWATLLCSLIAGIMYQIAASLPPAPFFESNEAYNTVFKIVPRVLVGGWLAVFLGDITNNYILAKLKVATKGKHLWFRTITSTIFGQGVNTTIFYIVALLGIIPASAMIASILVGWALKVFVEFLMTPITYLVVNYLKREEGVDHFDTETDFNPFKVTV